MLAITRCRLKLGNACFYSVQIEARQCLLLLGAESFAFQFAIQIFEDQDI